MMTREHASWQAHIPHPRCHGVRLFAWTRTTIWRTKARTILREPIKLLVIVVVWAVLLVGLYALAYRGIQTIYNAAGLGPFLLSRLWFLFLFVVMIMLAASQLTGAYSTLIRTPETQWWMVLPVSARTLCRAKWLESSCYSAWAVAMLILPLCLADLTVLQKPWWLMGWLLGILLVPFMAIVTALSTMFLLVWLRWLGRLAIRRELIPLGFVAACAVVFWVLGERHTETQQEVWFVALQELLPRMQMAMSMWLPSSWMATALDAGLNNRWGESALYAVLLWTTAVFCWRLLDHGAAVLLLPVLRQHAQPMIQTPDVGIGWLTIRQRGRTARTGQSVERSTEFFAPWWLRHPFLAALTKDVLLVIRDPMQWGQAVVFFGLLGAYFANIHRLTESNLVPAWKIGIAALNLACTLLVFGSLAVRFVFPQMSLEGRCLWLLRIAPGGLQRLVTSKLCLYGTFAVVVIEGLLVLSMGRLGIPLTIRWWLAGVGIIAALAIVGLTVGLGAWWIDLKAQDAARVVSSSTGALVLVLMLCYVGCVVAALVGAWTSAVSRSHGGLIWASVGLLVVSVVTGVLPVWGGLRRLERLEWTS